MALENLLSLSDNYNKQGISEERLAAIMPALRQYVAFWREYPDMFIDFMAGPNSTFHLYSYQRVFLRASLRHKYMYAVYPRAYSKSFMGVMSMVVKCVLYPRAKLFVSAGGKDLPFYTVMCIIIIAVENGKAEMLIRVEGEQCEPHATHR